MRDKSKVQSIIFSTNKWDIQTASKWLLINGFEVKKTDQKTKNFIRFRQINPKPLENKGYHFVNKKLGESGIELVLAYPPTIKKGGKLSVAQIRRFMNASYEKSPEEKIDDFVIDQELSNDYAKTYFNPLTHHAVVVHRGTSGALDWLNNVAYATGYYNYTPRYWTGKKIQQNAELKYGAKNVSTLGHSQGAVLTRKLGKNSKEMITLNPAWLGENQAPNEYVIRSGADAVSSGLAPVNWLKNKLYPGYTHHHNITIPRENLYDVIGEHSPEILNRLQDQERMIGEGISKHAYMPIMSGPMTGSGQNCQGANCSSQIQDIYSPEILDEILTEIYEFARMGSGTHLNREKLIQFLKEQPKIYEKLLDLLDEIEDYKEEIRKIQKKQPVNTNEIWLLHQKIEGAAIVKFNVLTEIINSVKRRGGRRPKMIVCGRECKCGGNC
jgi:hypothetical protein